MADNPIKHSDIIEQGDPFEDTIRGLEQLLRMLKKTAKEYLKFAKAQDSSTKQGKKNIQAVAKATNELSSRERDAIRIKKQLRKEREKLRSMDTAEFRALVKTKEAVRAKNLELRSAAKAMRTGAKTTNTWRKALGSFAAKFNTIGNIAANVASTITRQFVRAVREAIKVISTFEQAMADVRSITQATDKEFNLLRVSAKKLGQTTKFTASEVAKLQKEYAKLGFSTEEILKAQKATLSLAAATNTELPRATEVVGITLRQFGLQASETQRVVDVMAKSFISSGLDMEKFAESMKFVAPAAKASNISLERTTAMLGLLATSGIAGSLSGTSLRRIFTLMAISGRDAAERIRELSIEEIGLAEANAEVQQRAATALLVLADGVADIDDFEEALRNAGGTAKEVADVQLDTLNNQLILLKSAWDGVLISLGDTEGAVEGTKDAIGTFAKALNLLSSSIENAREKDGLWRKSQKATRKVVLENIPILGRLFRTKNRIVTVVDTLHARQEELNESTEDLQETWESPGGANDFFVKLNKVKTELEDIEKLIKRLDEFKFKEEDLDPIDPDLPGEGVTTTPEQKRQAQQNLDEAQVRRDQAEATRQAKEKEAADKRAKIADEEEKLKQDKIAATFELANRLTTTFTDLFARQKEKELSAAGDNAEKRLEIEKKFAQREQILAISQAVIDGAASILKTKATLGLPAAIPFMIADAAITAAQIGVIASQKFGEGEIDILGPSHSRGGINAEIEGGESVINKHSTAKYRGLLEAINTNDTAAIADAALQNQAFHEVWGRTGIRETTTNYRDPYMKKLYEAFIETPTIIPDGPRTERYPNGRTRIING